MSDNPKLRKNGGPGTKVGNFLRGLKGKVLPSVLDAVGVGDIGRAIGIIQADPNKSGLTAEQVDKVMEYYKMDLADIQSARKMQVEALKQNDLFSKRYLYYLATGVISFVIIITIALFFVTIPKDNKTIIDMVIGIIFGGFTSIMAFFFGSSKGSKDKEEQINRMQK